jgi:hypothetical protein
MFRHLQIPLSHQRLTRDKQITDALSLILTVAAFRLTWLYWENASLLLEP